MIVGIAWGVAVAVALVVLGYGGYELRWKRARLAADVSSLAEVVGGLAVVQRELAAAATRLPIRDRAG